MEADLTTATTKPKSRKKVDARMNSIKDKMAVAYMHGINSTINYAMDVMGRDHDGLGTDLLITNRTLGLTRKVASEANQINVQLKGTSLSSTSMVQPTQNGVRYNMSDVLYPIGMAHYLVVVVLPEESELESWRTVDADVLSLKATAYYKLVVGKLNSGWVYFTDDEILTPESYIQLFEAAKNKGIT